MLLRQPGCSRAVQRQARAQLDHVWISDEVLRSTFEAFCINQPTKRYGSSVPGPLEFRKRMGKRRLAGLSEAPPVSSQPQWPSWGLFGAKDMTQWSWEAPNRPPSLRDKDSNHNTSWQAEKDIVALHERALGSPSTLDLEDTTLFCVASPAVRSLHEVVNLTNTIPEMEEEYVTILQEPAVATQWTFDNTATVAMPPAASEVANTHVSADIVPTASHITRTFTREDIIKFQDDLKFSERGQIARLCQEFNKQLLEGISVGSTSDDDIYWALREVPKWVVDVCLDKTQARALNLDFCCAIWEGIELRPGEASGLLINELLFCLGDRSNVFGLQQLVLRIVRAASSKQISYMVPGLQQLAVVWVFQWPSMGSLLRPRLRGEIPERHVLAWKRLQESKLCLASCLTRLPSDELERTVEQITKCVIKESALQFDGIPWTRRNIRYHFLSVIANMPTSTEKILIRACSTVISAARTESDLEMSSELTMDQACRLLLDYWRSHGTISQASWTRVREMHLRFTLELRDVLARFLRALHLNNELDSAKLSTVFDVMSRLYSPLISHRALISPLVQDIHFPRRIFHTEIARISSFDNGSLKALDLFRFYSMRYVSGTLKIPPLDVKQCGDFMVNLINNPRVHDQQIWAALGVRKLDSGRLSSHVRKLPSSFGQQLSNQRVELVEKMAVAFANRTHGSDRVALRNVHLCILYLRRRGCPISKETIRALSQASLVRDLWHGKSVDVKKHKWVMDYVARVEGPKVAAEMYQALDARRANEDLQRRMREREGNPLELKGPID